MNLRVEKSFGAGRGAQARLRGRNLETTVRRLFLIGLASAVWPAVAGANDSTAHLGAGGLVLARTDAIAMKEERLVISEKEITVDYVFANQTDADIESVVAFPMPEIAGSPYEVPSLPDAEDDNFIDFSVTMAGSAIQTALDQRARAVGVDVTDALAEHDVPLMPFGDDTIAALQKLPENVAADFLARGLIVIDEYDDGSGWKRVRTPFWSLQSTYWWRAGFPAGRDVAVSHRYAPSVGSSVGLMFLEDGRPGGDALAEYRRRYCMDRAFEEALGRAARRSPDGYNGLTETRLSYVLGTGGHWAGGTIGRFTLVVDKGDADALVSFCGTGVRKTGPTTFEMTAQDFTPPDSLNVLIVRRIDN
jgi:hypothetical protein